MPTKRWTQIAPLLDGAWSNSAQKDHDAVVLRFFEDRNFKEVGAALGASEDAAKMRVSRALEKLRKFFTKRGVNSTTAVIAGADFRQFHSSRAGGAGKIRDRRGDCQRRGGFNFNLNPHQRSIENYGMDKSKNRSGWRHCNSLCFDYNNACNSPHSYTSHPNVDKKSTCRCRLCYAGSRHENIALGNQQWRRGHGIGKPDAGGKVHCSRSISGKIWCNRSSMERTNDRHQFSNHC